MFHRDRVMQRIVLDVCVRACVYSLREVLSASVACTVIGATLFIINVIKTMIADAWMDMGTRQKAADSLTDGNACHSSQLKQHCSSQETTSIGPACLQALLTLSCRHKYRNDP